MYTQNKVILLVMFTFLLVGSVFAYISFTSKENFNLESFCAKYFYDKFTIYEGAKFNNGLCEAVYPNARLIEGAN